MTLMNLLMIVFFGEARRRNGQNLPIVFGHTDYGLWLVHGCNLFNFSHSLPSSPPSILPSYSPLGYAHVPKDSQQSRWNPPPPLPRLSQLTPTGLGFRKRMVYDWMSTSFYKMWFERNSLTTLIGTISDCIRLIRMVQLSSVGSNSQYDPQNSQQNGICVTSKQSLEKLQEVLRGHSPAIVSIAEQPREGLQVAYCANGQFYASNYAVGTWYNMGLIYTNWQTVFYSRFPPLAPHWPWFQCV